MKVHIKHVLMCPGVHIHIESLMWPGLKLVTSKRSQNDTHFDVEVDVSSKRVAVMLGVKHAILLVQLLLLLLLPLLTQNETRPTRPKVTKTRRGRVTLLPPPRFVDQVDPTPLTRTER